MFQGCFKVAPHIGFVDVGQWKTFYYKNADPEVAEPSLKWVNRGTQIKLIQTVSLAVHRSAPQMEPSRNGVEEASAKPRRNCRKWSNGMMEV